jgi:hypothetical protein
MARPRDIRPGQKGDRLDGVDLHLGFRLAPNQTVEDYLAIGDELLRSEGIDPTWRGFEKSPQSSKQ